MRRIIILEDRPSDDGCVGGCLGAMLLLILLVGGIAIWPIMIGAARDDIKSFLIFLGVVIFSCIGTTSVYYTVNKERMGQRGFFSIFGVIYVFTAIVTGIMLHFAFLLTDESYEVSKGIWTIVMLAIIVTLVPSAIAAAVCMSLKNK